MPTKQSEEVAKLKSSIESDDEQMGGWDDDLKSKYLNYKATATKAGWHVARPAEYAAARSYHMYALSQQMGGSKNQPQQPIQRPAAQQGNIAIPQGTVSGGSGQSGQLTPQYNKQ
jgi:hypothetical protein